MGSSGERPSSQPVVPEQHTTPPVVGGAICLVNSVNERDLSLLTSYAEVTLRGQLLRGTMAF
ncbi:hypothetical protein JCGZ_01376 [Jatropha curcas]|uniref:Uncharacterized protein n=1 Tax=Jatropha curcas TaxID=180498 RepID=A0A067L8U6_JATCU|nr:hypothetical protein JCGZ_01376 [Jatropha curcas]